MKKLRYSLFAGIFGLVTIHAQVLIGGDNTDSPHENAILSILNEGKTSETSKGFILPTVDGFENLPLYDASEPDLFIDDESYEGMILYVKDENEKRAFYYNGQEWVDAFTNRYQLRTKVSLDPSIPEGSLPQTTCVLIACNEINVPLNLFRADDVDELRIVDAASGGLKIHSDGLYRVQTSFTFRSSGLHVTPPQISIQTIKNDEIVGQAIANMNTLLISGNAPMTATATFNIWATAGDIIKFSAGGAIPILTVADTYTVQPNVNTYAIVERIL
jgi:hypothetical protein